MIRVQVSDATGPNFTIIVSQLRSPYLHIVLLIIIQVGMCLTGPREIHLTNVLMC